MRTISRLGVALAVVGVFGTASLAYADVAPAVVAPVVDLTGIATSVVGAVFSILGALAVAIVNKYVKDASARAVLTEAIGNSVGTLQQVAQGAVKTVDPSIVLPAALAPYASGVQYVLDHAGPEAERFDLDPTAIAEKIEAKLGLANVAHNLAVTASPAAENPKPLAPVPAA